jgi:hypothetical protein
MYRRQTDLFFSCQSFNFNFKLTLKFAQGGGPGGNDVLSAHFPRDNVHHFRVHYSPRGCSAEAWWSQVWSDLIDPAIEVRERERERVMRWRRIFLQSTNDWGGQSCSDLNKVRERWRDSERGERRERERERERDFIRKQWVHGGGQERG